MVPSGKFAKSSVGVQLLKKAGNGNFIPVNIINKNVFFPLFLLARDLAIPDFFIVHLHLICISSWF